MPGVKHDLKSASLAPTGTGDLVGITAVPSKSIVVVAFAMVASAATVASFKSASTALTGGFSLAINGGVALAAGPDMWLFRTQPGEQLTVAQSVDGVRGFITYYLV